MLRGVVLGGTENSVRGLFAGQFLLRRNRRNILGVRTIFIVETNRCNEKKLRIGKYSKSSWDQDLYSLSACELTARVGRVVDVEQNSRLQVGARIRSSDLYIGS